MRRAAPIALAVVALAGGVFVAQLGWSSVSRPPATGEVALQLIVVAAAVLLVASRVAGKR